MTTGIFQVINNFQKLAEDEEDEMTFCFAILLNSAVNQSIESFLFLIRNSLN